MNPEKRKAEENNELYIESCRNQYKYQEATELGKVEASNELKDIIRRLVSYHHKSKAKESKEAEIIEESSSNKSKKIRLGWRTWSLGSIKSDDSGNQSHIFQDFINVVQQRFSSINVYVPMIHFDRSSNSLNEIQDLLKRPLVGRHLKYLMQSLDSVVSTPFCYLAKNSDPISLQLAMNYIEANELSNNIYVIHFVDDRKVINAMSEYSREYSKFMESKYLIEGEEAIPADIPAPGKGLVLNLLSKQFDEEKAATSAIEQLSLESCLLTLPHDTQLLLKHVATLDAFYT